MSETSNPAFPHSDAVSQVAADLVNAWRKLERLGLSRTQIHQLLRDDLPASNHSKMLNEASIRHVKILQQVMSGTLVKQAMAEHGLVYSGKKSILYTGAKKCYRVLAIDRPYIHEVSPCRVEHKQYWLDLATKALGVLESPDCNARCPLQSNME
jgi:hypothetical protein